jgi:NurA domain
MVIEQYTMTTPRYNFPQTSMDTTLPQRFLELSIHSLQQVRNQSFQLNQQPIQQDGQYDNCPMTLQLNRRPLLLVPKSKETLIAAVDTSTIKIGETGTGIIIAVRGANVWKQNHTYRYTRLGPFIFHITEDNKKEVYKSLERSYFNTQYESNHQNAPNLLQMPTRLASLLERWLQAMIAKTATNGLLLFDGSLMSGTADSPVQRMREILTTARRHNNMTFAFSKATSLRSNGYLITDLLPDGDPPYLLETTGLRFKPPFVLLGDVYVARLNKANLSFRLDIDREIPAENRLEAVERLIGNDVFQSYPETLRLSHILCTFTANEVLAIQHFITREHGIRIVNRPDMHRLLFGSFGKGEGYA